MVRWECHVKYSCGSTLHYLIDGGDMTEALAQASNYTRNKCPGHPSAEIRLVTVEFWDA